MSIQDVMAVVGEVVLLLVTIWAIIGFAISYTSLKDDVRALERRIEDVETVQLGGHVGAGQRE